MSDDVRPERSPGQKLLFTILVGALLAIPLFAIYLLVYDRSSQSTKAHESIAQGWGGAQVISGPVLVIPYTATSTETVVENGKQIQKTSTTAHELTVQAQAASLRSDLSPRQRHYSIYDAVVYEAHNVGAARFTLPDDLDRLGIDRATLALGKAELRFGVGDARGLFGAPPAVTLAGQKLPLKPGKGPRETGGSGFYSFLDASALQQGALEFHYDYSLRGNESLTLLPGGGDTRWTVSSAWPSPSFQGKFLPEKSNVAKTGFSALWRVGNLALGKSLVSVDDDNRQQGEVGADAGASVNLVTPVDLYDQVNRSVKYGFLFIGFTFTAFLMFDVIGGVRVSPIEYLLVGAGLILFFVMLLAFAEVVGFTPAYAIAAAAIIGLLTAYSAAVLGSWRRGGYIAGLLMGLYAALYVLLSLEAYSLLIGSLLLFVALAAVMYLTRGLDWGGRRLA